MNVKQKDRYEQLLESEEFHTLLIELENSNHPDEQLFKGIAHYKLNQPEQAETIFESLHKTYPSNEITTYLIITKIKLNDIISATKLYTELCLEENKAILDDIKNNQMENAMNRCLFLQSIPIERPQTEPAATVEEDINQCNYKAALDKLSTNASEKSCECC
tara:strand:- start:32 stop:517 length:486 start_codon:yes stop_codon:yes gene_type:complete